MKSIRNSIGSFYLTRREFLRFSSVGIAAALSLALPYPKYLDKVLNSVEQHWIKDDHYKDQFISAELLAPNQQGRVLNYSAYIYDSPSFSGNRINRYWRDSLLPITDITIGKSEDSFNMVWYEVGNGGFIHSSDIQPVFTILNPVIQEIPKGGVIAEVTVPFTDAHWDPGEDKPVAYRFYYATTYWLTEFIADDDDKPWYGVHDDKWDYMFYVPATHLRIIPQSEIMPLSSTVPMSRKRIEVHLREQVIIAYEFDQAVFMARVATGAKFSNGDFSTPPGSYTTFHKRFSRHMARGNLAANGYDLPGVPWNCYLTEEGIAIHGTYWHNNFGRPRSHGCINLTPQAAKWLFLWTLPTVPPDQEWVFEEPGTQVDIID